MLTRERLTFPGIVQGIGFRPKVYRLAMEFGLTGFVRNESRGVIVEAQSPHLDKLNKFIMMISENSEPSRLRLEALPEESAFLIAESSAQADADPVLSPDVAICGTCRKEFADPSSRRYRYPFIACAECGPRQSVSLALPYDRARTSWRDFPRCAACEVEYHNPLDRRFRAESISCPQCGPVLRLTQPSLGLELTGPAALEAAADILSLGGIVAAKGVGGFHLLADARSEAAVLELRARKRRPVKPFAVMVATADEALRMADVNQEELTALQSAAAPIVLVRKRLGLPLAESVAPGFNRLGLFLASTGYQIGLLERLGGPLVATSGNFSDEPVCLEIGEARSKLATVADAFLDHSLHIHNRHDDSIVQIAAGEVICIRRAKGYPVRPNINEFYISTPCVAAGADLKSLVAAAEGSKLVAGAQSGPLGSVAANDAHAADLKGLPFRYGIRPARIVVDLHPDYRSTLAGEKLNAPETIAVQHHCAHIASACAENGWLGKPVLGVAWDGTGFGLDGTSWGGEFILFGPRRIERVGSVLMFPLLGGDFAAREPRRVSYALARLAGIDSDSMAAALALSRQEIRLWDSEMATAPRSSSMGRLFDGVAGLLGVCFNASFEGEAAMRLQQIAEAGQEEGLSTEVSDAFVAGVSEDLWRWDWRELIRFLWTQRRSGASVSSLALLWHESLAELIARRAQALGRDLGPREVVLTGGVFQNTLLLEFSLSRLRRAGLNPGWNREIPTNDGGIAIGQLLCASEYLDALNAFQMVETQPPCPRVR